MEMNDQIIQHLMNTQTQMIQSLTQLQHESNNRGTVSNPAQTVSGQPLLPGTGGKPIGQWGYGTDIQTSLGTGLPSNVSSPIVPPATHAFPTGAVNPSQYGTIANTSPPLGDRLGQIQNRVVSDTKGFVSESIAEIRDFNAMGQSKESTEQYISERARGLQEQALNTAGGFATGATAAASMMLPMGFLPAAAIGAGTAAVVGGTVNTMVGEAKTALNYQDLLQDTDYKFINAFESTSDMGGIGMGLEDRQDISRYMRELGPEKFLDDADLSSILQGAADNNLLKSVSDVQSFKDKFSGIVDAVKEITVTLNASIEEATAFMGEMERRGITTQDMGMVAAQAKVTSSFTGKDAMETLNTVMSATDSVTANTAIDPTRVMSGMNQNIFLSQMLQDQAGEEDSPLYNYIKNSGGPTGAGTAYEQQIRGYVESQQGSSMLMAMAAPAFEWNEQEGGFELNTARLNEMMTDERGVNAMIQDSTSYMNNLTLDQKATLANSATDVFARDAGSQDFTRFGVQVGKRLQQQQAEQGVDISLSTALFQAGVVQDYEQADYMVGMAEMQEDPEMANAYQARILKEQQDSVAISESPSLGKRVGYWWERNFENPVGNVAQDFTDTVGGVTQDYQKWLTGLDDRSTVNAGADLPNLDRTSLEDFVEEATQSFNENQTRINELENERFKDEPFEWSSYGPFDLLGGPRRRDTDLDRGLVDEERAAEAIRGPEGEQFSGGQANIFNAHVESGNLVGEQLVEMQKNLDEGGYGGIGSRDAWRAQMSINRATGDYEGFFGNVNEASDTLKQWTRNAGGWVKDTFMGFIDENYEDKRPKDAMANFDLEEETKNLQTERKDLQGQLNELLVSDEDFRSMSEDELETLQQAIRTGDQEAVESITKVKGASELANDYRNMNEREAAYGEQADTYRQMSELTATLAKSGGALGDIFMASGLYSEPQIDALLGDLKKDGKETRKDLKEGELDYQGMFERSAEMEGEVSAIFEGMGDQDANKLADYLVQQSGDNQEVIQELYGDTYNSETGEGQVDQKNLQKYVMDMVRSQNINPTNKEKGIDSDEVTKVVGEHKKAFQNVLSGLQEEVQMMNNYSNGTPVSQSSLSSGE